MKNFVITFLVGALVVFGGLGVANALTFKSDGSVVKTSASKNIDFSSCIISEIQNPRNIGGPQVIGFLKDLFTDSQNLG